MKLKRMIMFVVGIVMCTSFVCYNNEKLINNNEGNIDDNDSKVEANDENILVELECKCDMEEIYNDVPKLCDSADIIIKCNVIGQEAFVKTGSSIYTDYEVKIEEIYKGDNMPDVIHLESLGGTITCAEYLEQVDAKDSMIGENEFKQKEINEKVIDMKVNGISSMKTGETYIVFATYNKKLKKYNPVGLYQCIFEEEYDDKYIRNLSDSDVASAGEKVVYELEQDDIDNCIQE